MKYKRIIYPIVIVLALFVIGYFIFTGKQVGELK